MKQTVIAIALIIVASLVCYNAIMYATGYHLVITWQEGMMICPGCERPLKPSAIVRIPVSQLDDDMLTDADYKRGYMTFCACNCGCCDELEEDYTTTDNGLQFYYYTGRQHYPVQ